VRHSEVPSPKDLKKLECRLYISGTALERNVGKMFELLKEVLSCPIFHNKELMKTHIFSTASGLEESIIGSGHRYALINAVSSFRASTFLNEIWSGITQVSFMNELLMDAQVDKLDVHVEKLQQLAGLLLNKPLTKVSLTTEEQYTKSVEARLGEFLDGTLSSPTPTVRNLGEIEIPTEKDNLKTFIAVPGVVNYVAKALPTVHYTHPDATKLQLLSEVITHQYLHREVREKGGAYGGGLSFNTGYLGFYSYRDPHVEKTLETFSKTLDWLKKTPIKDEWVEQAKFHVFSSLDAPVSPSKKGTTEFNTSVTWEMRQEKRERLLKTNKNDLIKVGEQYLKSDSSASIVVVGSNQNSHFKNDASWKYQEP